MKTLVLVLAMALGTSLAYADEPKETKKVCVDQMKDGKPVKDAKGNVNVPGGNAGKTGFKKKEPGHGAEKKGTGEVGGVDKKSLIGGKVR